MGLPLVALGVQPIPQPDVLGNAAKLSQLRGQQQAQAIQAQIAPLEVQQMQQQNEQQQLALQRTKAMNDAYANAVTIDPNTQQPTFDRGKLFNALAVAHQGAALPEIQKSFLELDETAGKVQAAKDAHIQASQDYMGELGSTWKASNYDPSVLGGLLAHAATNGYQQEAQQFAQAVQHVDPSKYPVIADQVMQGSNKQREVGAQETAALARKQQAAKAGEFTAPGADGVPHRMLPVEQPDGTYKNQDLGPAVEAGANAVEPQEMKAWLAKPENAGKDAADFMKYKAQLGPTTTFNLQQQGAGNSPLNEKQQATAQAILDGRLAPPSSFAQRTPYWQNIMGAVLEQDPQWSEQRAQVRKAFTTGKDGTNIGALNTATVHLDALQQAANALSNGNFRPGNQIYNYVQTQLGQAAPTNFEGIKSAVAGEMAQALKGNATDVEIANISKGITQQSSPTQLAGYIDSQLHILSQKLQTYQQRYQQQIPGDQAWTPILPQAQEVYARHGISPATAQGAAGAAAPKIGDIKTFPNGNKGKWDGKGYVLTTGG